MAKIALSGLEVLYLDPKPTLNQPSILGLGLVGMEAQQPHGLIHSLRSLLRLLAAFAPYKGRCFRIGSNRLCSLE